MKQDTEYCNLLLGKCDVCGETVDAYVGDGDCTCQNCGTTYLPTNSNKDTWIEDK